MEDVVLHQGDIINEILLHMAGLPFIYPPQGCQE